jgi:hypothetical protein
MSDMLHYGDECELILHMMKEQGVSFVGLSYAGDWMGDWPQYWDKDAYWSHSCEDMSIEQIAWHLWQVEDSVLYFERGEDEYGSALFIFGNGFGELVGNHSGDQFTYDLFDLIDYTSLSITDITEVFGIGRQTLSDLISAYKKVNGEEE